jgi:diketogulonate reductase-like aldo/keto reductase
MIPIVGARTGRQIEDSLGALEFELSTEQRGRLDEASRIELGFPHDFFTSETVRGFTDGGMFDRIDCHRS